jgi:hypothetical protein
VLENTLAEPAPSPAPKDKDDDKGTGKRSRAARGSAKVNDDNKDKDKGKGKGNKGKDKGNEEPHVPWYDRQPLLQFESRLNSLQRELEMTKSAAYDQEAKRIKTNLESSEKLAAMENKLIEANNLAKGAKTTRKAGKKAAKHVKRLQVEENRTRTQGNYGAAWGQDQAHWPPNNTNPPRSSKPKKSAKTWHRAPPAAQNQPFTAPYQQDAYEQQPPQQPPHLQHMQRPPQQATQPTLAFQENYSPQSGQELQHLRQQRHARRQMQDRMKDERHNREMRDLEDRIVAQHDTPFVRYMH